MAEVVPEGWKATSIGKLTRAESLFADGDWVESKDQDQDGDNRLIQLADIGDGRFLNKSARFMNDEQFKRLRCTSLLRGDILVARMPDPLGRACLFPGLLHRSATVVDVAIIRTNSAEPYWLMSAINSPDFRREIELNASGTTRTRISRGALANIALLTPPLPEQQKIAAILTSVDEVIEKTEAQISKLQDLKKGMMQELLTKGIGHTEFKDSPVGRIPGEWALEVAAVCISVMESGWSPQCDAEPASTGEWGVLKTTAVTWGGFDHSKNKRLPHALQPRPQFETRRGDVLVTRAGPAERVGVVAYVDVVPSRLMLSDKLIRLRAREKVCLPEYLAVWLSGHVVQKYFNERTTGLAQSQTNISQDILGKAPILLPSLEEQKIIASSLRSVSGRIQAFTEKYEHLLRLKKALMQDLLTGSVRVKVN